VSQRCQLNPAIVEYDLTMNDGRGTFQSASWRDDSVVEELYVISVPLLVS
jgi:hypothetical protein